MLLDVGVNQAPDKAVNSCMVLTQAIGYIAEKINEALSPGNLGDINGSTSYGFTDYMYMLFMGMIMVAVFMLVFETLNTVMDAGTGNGEHDFGWRRLFDTGLIKKWIKFLVLVTVGGAIFIYEYRPPISFRILRLDQDVFQSQIDNIANPLVNWVNPIDKVKAVGNVIKSSSETLGAFYFAIQAQVAAAQGQAMKAGETVWNDMHPPGTEVAVPPGQSGDAWSMSGWARRKMVEGAALTEAEKQAQEVSDGVLSKALTWIGNVLAGVGTAMFLLLMNIGLDIMIVRCLMFNAIYMMMAYKIAMLLLPIACVAAFWDRWESVLRGTLQVIIITVISLNVLTDLASIIVSPTGVQQLCQDANAQSLSSEPAASTLAYAKKIYADMNTGPNAGRVTKQEYLQKVTNELGDPTNAHVFNLDVTFWAPVRVILLMTIMVTLVGKIATVIGDTISGTMTYHRG